MVNVDECTFWITTTSPKGQWVNEYTLYVFVDQTTLFKMADEISKYIMALRTFIHQYTFTVKDQPVHQLTQSWSNPESWSWTHPKPLDTLRPEQNGRNFAENIFKCLLWMKIFESWFKCHWGLLVRAKLTGNHHWFKYCLIAGQRNRTEIH